MSEKIITKDEKIKNTWTTFLKKIEKKDKEYFKKVYENKGKKITETIFWNIFVESYTENNYPIEIMDVNLLKQYKEWTKKFISRL